MSDTVDWSEIVVGDVVELQGVPWDITLTTKGTAKNPRKVTAVRRDGKGSHTGSPTGKVKRLERAAPAIPGVSADDLATATVQARLGGDVLAVITPGDPWHSAPKVFTHPGTLAAHLYVYHAVRDWPEGESPKDMHDRLHRELAGGAVVHGLVDHTHDLEAAS